MPLLLDYRYVGCDGAWTTWNVPVADVQAALPSGHTAQDDAGQGIVTYAWMACDALETRTAVVNDTVLGWVTAAVEGPEPTEYLLRMLVQDDLLKRLWEAAGYPVVVGEHDQTPPPVGPVGPAWPGLWNVQQGQYAIDAATLTDATADALSWRMLHETVQGETEWTGTVRWGRPIAAPQATLTLPDDDPFAGSEPEPPRIFIVQGLEMAGNDLRLTPS